MDDAREGRLPFDLRGGRPRPTLARRLRRAVAMLVSVAITVGVVGGWAAYTRFDAKINRVAIGDLGKDRPAARKGTKNYLLVGTDSRPGLAGERSDTTILAHVGEDDKVTLTSFPRDLLVLVPEYTDKGTGKVHPPRENKFNYAISAGGATLLIKQVERLTGLRVDHYVSVDLAGFRTISDAIGGVDVCITEWGRSQRVWNPDAGRYFVSTNTDDPWSGFRGGPGTIHISGEQALAFVRQRHGLPNEDLSRTERQQYFLSRVLARISEGGVLNSPARINSLLGAVGSALNFGEGTDSFDLRGLADRLRGISNGSLGAQTVPTHTATRAEGAIKDDGTISTRVGAVQIYNQADLDALFRSLVADPGGTDPGGTDPGGTDSGGTDSGDGTARISVVNGSGTAGLAGKAVRGLAARGISAAVSADNGGNAPFSDFKSTWIRYGTGAEATARKILTHLPEAKLASDGSVDGVEIIVGAAFDGLADPAPSATPGTPGTSAAPDPASPVALAGAEPRPTGSAVPTPEPPKDCVY